jgi:hypothetical protein
LLQEFLVVFHQELLIPFKDACLKELTQRVNGLKGDWGPKFKRGKRAMLVPKPRERKLKKE